MLFRSQAEWTSSRTTAQKAANLLGPGAPDRNNGNYYVAPKQTVFTDEAVDVVMGGDGNDMIYFDSQQDTRFVDLDPTDYLVDLH